MPSDFVSVIKPTAAKSAEESTEIAAAGQRRTLSEHSYVRRTAQLSQILLQL